MKGGSSWANTLLKVVHVLLFMLIFVYLYYILKTSASPPHSCSVEHDYNIESPVVETHESFQRITDDPEKLYLYSAYFDHIDKSTKLIGGGKAYTKMPVYCQFYNHNKKYISFSHRLGQIVDIQQATPKNRYKYKVVWVRCPIKSNDVQLPKYVSITLDPTFNYTSKPENLFQIKFNSITGTSPINFTVCTGPTYSYDSPLRFLEWIEFYKLMGVSHFIFTNVSIGPRTSCLMKQYQLNGEAGIEILKWDPPFEVDAEIYMYCSEIQNNDCVYRTRGLSQYVISLDLDELIIPSVDAKVTNYMDLIKLIEKQKPAKFGQVSGYLFNNGYFVPSNTNTNSTTADQQLNLTMNENLESQIYSKLVLSTKKARGVTLYNRRSKYIGNPNLINVSDIHFVRESQPGSNNYAVPPELAYLHHYRNKLPSKIKIDPIQIIDKSGQRFAKQLSVNVAQSLRKYGKVCNIL